MISAALVKELREKTGAGMLDCKNALEESNGDMGKAVDWLREKGIAKAAKKAGRIAAEGLVKLCFIDNQAVIIEMNTETDFVAKNEQFLSLLDVVANAVLENKPADLDSASKIEVEGESIESRIINATANIGEKISLRRFVVEEKEKEQIFGLYTHFDNRIAVITVLDGGSEEVAKDIAMQVASMAPSFVSRGDMDEDFINHEKDIQRGIIANDETLANKPEKVLAGILEGRLSKTLQEMCLLDQVFFKNQDIKVSQFLKENNANCLRFVRFMVGEGLEKRTDDFAAEVASML